MRRAVAPTTRGAILGRDLTVLARGAADAREYPQGAALLADHGLRCRARHRRDAAEPRRAGLAGRRRYGQGGLEASLDDMLAGAPRVSLVAAGASGNRLLARHPGRRPRSVVTTLDASLQRTATTLLAGRLGGIVVLTPAAGRCGWRPAWAWTEASRRARRSRS